MLFPLSGLLTYLAFAASSNLLPSVNAYTTPREDLELLHSGHPSIPLWQAIHADRQRKSEATQALSGSQDQEDFQISALRGYEGGQKVLMASGGGDKKKHDPSDGSHAEPSEDKRYPAHCFYQPLDHFDPKNNVTFCQRYWVSLEHYDPRRGESAPVFVLDGGETSGANRLPFLEKGIVNILSNATSGIGIILEHRYYGKSLPNVSYPSYEPMTLSTDDLRFLNNEQAEMDSVRFIQNLDLGHLDDSLLSMTGPENRPWVYYGGSYAGARAAHMIKGWGYEGNMLDAIPPVHPAVNHTYRPRGLDAENPKHGRISTGKSRIGVDVDISSTHEMVSGKKPKGLLWGSIASSAVTHAQISYPEYHEAIRRWAPAKCMRTLEEAVETIDWLLEIGNGALRKRVQGLFGLEDLEHVEDFTTVIGGVVGGWQARNWDPEVGSMEFYRFCDILTAGGASSQIGWVKIGSEILNYASYVKENIVSKCPADTDGHRNIEDCFGTYNVEKYRQTDLSQKWRLWLFQVCNQWGYFMPAPLKGKRILSKFVTLDYSRKTCAQAFPPGKYHTVPEWPDVESVNARGDFELSADRLAFIDGDSDPWRPATPQSDYAPKRNDTILRPVKWIKDAVHHFDENGLLDPSAEPTRIQSVHADEIAFVKSWLKDWKEAKAAGRV